MKKSTRDHVTVPMSIAFAKGIRETCSKVWEDPQDFYFTTQDTERLATFLEIMGVNIQKYEDRQKEG